MTLLNLKPTKLLLLALLIANVAIGQSTEGLEQLKEKYKGYKVIFKEHQETVIIDLVKGVPTVKSEFHDEFLILNQNGASMMGQEEIEFSSFHEIEKINAYALIPEEKGYKKVKATNFQTRDAETSGSIFHDDNKVTSFVYPSLKEGALRVLEYSETVSENRFPFGFFFSAYIPVEQGVFTINCDSNIHITARIFNNENGKIKFKEELVKGRRIMTWTCAAPTQLKSEDRAATSRYYAQHVMAQIASYNGKNGKVQVLETPKDLHNWYKTNIEKVVNEKPSAELVTLTDSIVKGIDGEVEKVKAVYYWVQNNIKYIAFEQGESGFIPRLPSDICSKRYGDCKDMASLIYAMLKIVNVPAHLTWIGTRHIPYNYSDFPSSAVDNHMIATYYEGDKPVFLDATCSFLPYGYPSYGILGKEAFVHISNDEFRIEKVPSLTIHETTYRDTSRVSFDGKTLIGHEDMYCSGFYNVFINDLFKNVASDKLNRLVENLNEKGNNSFHVTNAKAYHVGERDSVLYVECDFEVKNYVSSYENEVYINMVLEKDITYGDLPKERNAPYEIESLSNNIYTVILDVPAGYHVKSLPKSADYHSDFVDYTMNYVEQDGKVKMDIVFNLKFLVMYPKDFASWNEFVKLMKSSMAESVVLEKVN
jgi:transglutaminase-like putative cysteine protease